MPTLLPDFSRTLVKNALSQGRTNPHLLFYRYLKGNQSGSQNEQKNAAILEKDFIPKCDLGMLRALRRRQGADLKQWAANHPDGEVCSESFQLLGRMVVGMGISSSFENGLLLDWVHGVPFINGEAVKGSARSYARERIEADSDGADRDDFREIFGSIRKGETDPDAIRRKKALFFNAYPETESNLFDVDMITCHYGPYYTGNPVEAPGDWHNPNPVAFLTVREDVVFRFSVASPDASHARKAMAWLKGALIQNGIGAKTRVGYGHFVSVETAPEGPGEPDRNDAPPSSGLMMKIRTTQASKLPGMANDLVKDIIAVSEPEEKRQAARELLGRFNSKTRKKSRNKPWMQQLQTIAGESS